MVFKFKYYYYYWRKYVMKFRYLVILLPILFFCKETAQEPKSLAKPEVISAYESILAENQTVHDKMISEPDTLPDLDSLIASLESAGKIVEDLGLKKSLEEEIRILKDVKGKDQESFFAGISRFTEHLDTSMKTGGVKVAGYNKFFCPMVTKYWFSKGEEISNPYAKDMRDCGEMIQ